MTSRWSYALAMGGALLLAPVAVPTLRAEPPVPPPSAEPAPSASQRRPPHEHLREHAERWLQPHHPGSPSALPSAWPAPSAFPSASAGALDVRLDLARKWAELAQTRLERRERHRAQLVSELGARLGEPAVRAELATHGKRLAELNRLQFLAANARSGEARDKLLARIQKLQQRELVRHQARLAKLTAAPPAPSSSAGTP